MVAAVAARIQAFIASSLDGFIAGSNDELDWLSGFDGARDTFTPFFASVGAMLMGRRTFDVVSRFEGEWPYGETPVLVATSRPLETQRENVNAVSGSIENMVETARRAAGAKSVYIDGGALIRSALDAGLVDDITVTVIPKVLGTGIPLFAGTSQQHDLELVSATELGGGLAELRYRPRRQS